MSKPSGIPVLNSHHNMLCMGAVWKKTIRSVNHVFLAYLNDSLSDIYIGYILGYLYKYIGQIVLQVEPKYTRKISQTKSFFFSSGAAHAV